MYRSHFSQDNCQKPADDELCDLSDKALETFDIAPPDELPSLPHNQEQRRQENLPPFFSIAPHQHSRSIGHEDSPEPVCSYHQVVSRDSGADELLADVVRLTSALGYPIQPTFERRQAPVNKGGLDDLDGKRRESETHFPDQMEMPGYQSLQETPSQALFSSRDHGNRAFDHPEKTGMTHPSSHVAHTRGAPATKGPLEPSSKPFMDTASDQLAEGLEVISSKFLAHHDLLCDLDDEFYDRADEGLGLSSVHQSLVNDPSAGPMSIGSLISYYGNSNPLDSIENSSINGSPPDIGLQRKQSEANDAMEFSDASASAVCFFHFYMYPARCE